MSPDNVYNHALNALARSRCSLPKLRRIKETYKDQIDSERQFERIANVEDLLKTLEKRDCISNDVFEHICNELNRTDIISTIETGRISERDTVYYVPSSEASNGRHKVLPEVPRDADVHAFEVISCQIGKKWKDFARALGIGEGHIDELQATYRDRTYEIVIEILKYHKNSSDERYWKIFLYSALEKARRRDLSRSIKELYARHGL
ncbi:unnamed protein product [Callosobruchus maculatus]|uniref:Death domain-containing protein n=1 Tax=Callosobruchus maculatus TaxID=64391 RepID=A0A653DNW6_CALMS|nr:unnamed protein product [Callosobruchus maculatus]